MHIINLLQSKFGHYSEYLEEIIIIWVPWRDNNSINISSIEFSDRIIRDFINSINIKEGTIPDGIAPLFKKKQFTETISVPLNLIFT